LPLQANYDLWQAQQEYAADDVEEIYCAAQSVSQNKKTKTLLLN
jgi:hypothetical protein